MGQGNARQARQRAALTTQPGDEGTEVQELPGGVYRARYVWNKAVLAEGLGVDGALEALRRTHLMIGNSADGRWAGNSAGDNAMGGKTNVKPKRPKPKPAQSAPPPEVVEPAPPPVVETKVAGPPPPAAKAPAVKAGPKRAKPDDQPVKVSKTRDGMKKAGDGLPVDLVGSMLGEGSIVAVPVSTPGPEDQDMPDVRLRLGYVKKVGKSYIDVVTFVTADETEPFRCTDPRNELVEVNGELLDSRVPLYEAVKFAAATSRY